MKEIIKKYYIQAISANLLEALTQRAADDSRITERFGFKCLDRKGQIISQNLFEVPPDIYREVLSRRNDYYFIEYIGDEGKLPRNIRENYPHLPHDFKLRRRSAKKGTIKGTSLLRRYVRREKKFQGVH